jgi:hypothetical protein
MALTFTDVKRVNIQKSGGIRFAIIDITFDSSYVTAGWTINASDVKLSGILGMTAMGPQVAAAGATFGFVPGADTTTCKLLAFKSNTAALFQEIAAADLNTRVVRFWVVGL